MNSLLQTIRKVFLTPLDILTESKRTALRLTKTTTKNKHNNPNPKYRGVKRLEGRRVTAGTKLATQFRLKWHPGANVGMGRNGTLYAIIPGRVKVTAEKCNLNWEHGFVKRAYSELKGVDLYKKYFHVIPKPQHHRFKLMDQI